MKLWIEHHSWGEVSAEFCDPLGAAAAARELTCPQIPPQQNQLRLMQPRAATLHKQLRAVTLPNQLHAGCSFVLPVVRRLGGAYHLLKGWLLNFVTNKLSISSIELTYGILSTIRISHIFRMDTPRVFHIFLYIVPG